MCFTQYIEFNFETSVESKCQACMYLFYSTINCNRMHFKMGIIEFEGDSSLLASPF